MDTFSAVIDSFGGPGKFAAAIGIEPGHARAMKTRNSIPSEYWHEVVTAAVRLKIQGVTLALLARLEALAAGRLKVVS
jgi:hypothetical protein